MSNEAVAALLEEAGVPAGVVNVVPTSRPGPVVAAMLADSRVRKLIGAARQDRRAPHVATAAAGT